MDQRTITSLFESAERGDAGASEALFAALYGELHRMAKRELGRRRDAGRAGPRVCRWRHGERMLIEARAVLKDVPGRQGREAAATRDRLAALSAARPTQ